MLLHLHFKVTRTFQMNSTSSSQQPSHSPTPSAGSTASLPKPDQWLGQIVKSASPVPGKMDGTSPRRTPSFTAHMRAISLDSAESCPRPSGQPDPFDAEWATSRQRNTNPFLNANGAPRPFQVQL